MQDLTVGNYRSYMPTRYQEVTLGSHGLETPDRTRLWGVRTVLHYLKGSEHKIVHAYKVSGWGCKISRVRQTRSYMPTRYQDQAAGSHGFRIPYRTRLERIRTGLQDRTGSDQQIQHAFKVSSLCCRTSRVRHIRSNLPTRYQVGVAGSHGLGTTDRTWLLAISRWLQDLTGSKHQIERAYEVSERCCIISRARNTRSYMPTRYQDGAAGPHGFGKQDRTCLRGITTGLQDLTGLEQQIQHDYAVSGRGCKISRVRKTR